MTLPSTIQLPLHSDYIQSDDPAENEKYMRELVFTLQTMYEDLASGINGTIRSDNEIQRSQWVPTLQGAGVAGTFTYTHQSGYALRQGLWIDAWGDISWSAAGTAAGNLYVELPYKVARTNNMPFVGVVQPSSVAYTAGTEIVINAISDTYRGEFWNTGTGIATANQAVVASGRLIFHVRYLGQDEE